MIREDLDQRGTSLSKEKLMKGKRHLQLLTITTIIVLTCAAALSTILLPATAAKAAAPTGLHVVGNQIKDGSNRVIVPHGVDRMGGEYACIQTSQNGGSTFDGPVNQAAVSAMLSWG